MTKNRYELSFELTPEDNERLAELCGQFDENLRQIERYLGVEINNRGTKFKIIGIKESCEQAQNVIKNIYAATKDHRDFSSSDIYLFLKNIENQVAKTVNKEKLASITIKTSKTQIQPHSLNQYYYLKHILDHDINFGIGPSGTGKTYLAVACAVQALEEEQVQRILLVRPAVEAGEKLGYLPGSMTQKIDPYLRPLYDALYEMLGFDKVNNLLEQDVIEIAPLAFMRGRTINDSFMILDESQNTTVEQMKMFLTRIGFGSKAIVTGDITQTDLPKNQQSGLRNAIEVLKDIEAISFTFFQALDVVRHPIVQQVVEAYERQQ